MQRREGSRWRWIRVAYRRCVSFFFSSRRRHTRYIGDWSSDVCSSDLSAERTRGMAQATKASLAEAAPNLVGVLGLLALGPLLLLLLPDGALLAGSIPLRSEERRVGKECRLGWSPAHYKNTEQARNHDI